MLRLEKYSIGVGDRFAHQAKAQLRACVLAGEAGVDVIPVWNKSNREHMIIGSDPGSVREAADEAVRQLEWTKAHHVDADHINLETVDRYLAASDFFTIDVAAFIGKPADPSGVSRFLARHPELATSSAADRPVEKYLASVQEAGRIYRRIASAKGEGTFITEVSMDETDVPQTPPELLIILALIADEKIPIQTIAPKFTGRFNKGVDYCGDVAQFATEFENDLAVIARAVEQYDLPRHLKLSVHSGSDKFSIYGAIHKALVQSGAGVHVKTAGTTWLEELIGLAEAGGEGLAIAKEIYAQAYANREALCEPYAAVIDIDPAKLPEPSEVAAWTSDDYTEALRHDPACPRFNPNVRQLLHVGFKIAAHMGTKPGERYSRIVEECEETISRNVTENLFARHILPIFL
jgi:tagaturonate epimerase